MKRPNLPSWLMPCIALCALFSLASIYYRVRVEGRNKATELAVEIEAVQNLAASQGLPMQAALRQLKEAGLGAVVLSETTLADLLNARQLELVLGKKGATLTVTDPDPTEASSLQRRVLAGIKRRWPALNVTATPNGVGIEGEIPSLSAFRGLSIGLDLFEARTARRADMRIIARFSNPVGATEAYVRGTIAQAKLDGASIYLPLGEQVLGRRDALKALVDALRTQDIAYASPEFTKLGGDANVLDEMPNNVVRLHSAQSAELDKLPLVEAVDRYARASRERNQRVLLLRPVSNASEKPLDSLKDFVGSVAKAVEKAGNKIGPARPFQDSGVPQWLFLLIGVSAAFPLWCLIDSFEINGNMRTAVKLALLGLGVACFLPHVRMPMAILASLAFPILSFLWQDENTTTHPVLQYLIMTLTSLVGGLVVAGLLNGLPYFIRAEQFSAVKLSVFLPILVVGLYSLARQMDLRTALRDPLTYRTSLMALLLLGVLAFVISRTGNDNPAGVSSVELKLRDILDKVLLVRPRTKEFLFGHPALILGICLLSWQRSKVHRRWVSPVSLDPEEAQVSPLESAREVPLAGGYPLGGWIALCLAIGAMGQTDVVNTLCHLHTPVLLSFQRIAVGWLAGGIFGFGAWWLAKGWLQRWNLLG